MSDGLCNCEGELLAPETYPTPKLNNHPSADKIINYSAILHIGWPFSSIRNATTRHALVTDLSR
jgi:hypothetical protein